MDVKFWVVSEGSHPRPLRACLVFATKTLPAHLLEEVGQAEQRKALTLPESAKWVPSLNLGAQAATRWEEPVPGAEQVSGTGARCQAWCQVPGVRCAAGVGPSVGAQ